jgi:hypothetical protein
MSGAQLIGWATTRPPQPRQGDGLDQHVVLAEPGQGGRVSYRVCTLRTAAGAVRMLERTVDSYEAVLDLLTERDPLGEAATLRDLRNSWDERIGEHGLDEAMHDGYRTWQQRDLDRWLDWNPVHLISPDRWAAHDGDPDVVTTVAEALDTLRERIEQRTDGIIAPGGNPDDGRRLACWTLKSDGDGWDSDLSWRTNLDVLTDGSEIYVRRVTPIVLEPTWRAAPALRRR